MVCVTTVRYSVHFNGTSLVLSAPLMVFSQRDPLSPYLFLLVADCLSILVKNDERQGLVSGIKVSWRGPGISHLLFANDSVLFFKLNVNQAERVRELLANFEQGTGQKLSPSKCSLLIRQGSDPVVAEEVCRILGVESVDFEKYLGLPVPTGRFKRGQVQPIEECYTKRMTDRNERTLSHVAKEVLINSVAQKGCLLIP
jgi:hypothetical protein